MKYYVTTYTDSDKGRIRYKTNELTPKHEALRDAYGVSTTMYDTGIDWPFGVYCERIGRSRKVAR